MRRTIVLLSLAALALFGACSPEEEQPGLLLSPLVHEQATRSDRIACGTREIGSAEKYDGNGLSVRVILVEFEDTPEDKRFTDGEISSITNRLFGDSDSVKDLYSEMSFGENILEGSVEGPISITRSYYEHCEYSGDSDENPGINHEAWRELAYAEAVAEGVDFEGVGTVLYAFPRGTICTRTEENGSETTLGGFYDDLEILMFIWNNTGVWVHELGHRLGFGHSWTATGESDFSCIMSPTSWNVDHWVPLRQANGHWKNKANMYVEGRTLDLTDPGDHTLYLVPTERYPGEVDDPDGAVAYQNIRVYPPNTNPNTSAISISYRRAEGDYDSHPYFLNLMNRIYIQERYGSFDVKSTALEQGEFWSNDFCSVAAITDGLHGEGDDYVQLLVRVGQPAPSVSLPPGYASIGGDLPTDKPLAYFTLEVTNNAMADEPVAIFELSVSEHGGFDVVPKYMQVAVAPGATGTVPVAVVADGVIAHGVHLFSITVSDPAGVYGPTTAIASLMVDREAPAVPADLTAVATCTRATLAWTASEGASRYEVVRDGSVVFSTAEDTWTDDPLELNSIYTYAVRSIDVFDNISDWSEEITVSTFCGEGLITSVPEPVQYVTRHRPGVPVTRTFDVQVENLDAAGCDPEIGYWSFAISMPSFEVFPAVRSAVYVNPGVTGFAHPRAQLGPDPAEGEYVMSTEFYNEVDYDGVSASETLTVIVDYSAPSAPAALQGRQLTSTATELNWVAATDAVSGVVAYEIELNGVIVDEVTGTTFVRDGFDPNARYEYRVRARDAAGHVSAWSDGIVLGCGKCALAAS